MRTEPFVQILYPLPWTPVPDRLLTCRRLSLIPHLVPQCMNPCAISTRRPPYYCIVVNRRCPPSPPSLRLVLARPSGADHSGIHALVYWICYGMPLILHPDMPCPVPDSHPGRDSGILYAFSLRMRFMARRTGLYSTAISTKFPTPWAMSKGMPATHQVNPAYRPPRRPLSAVPIAT